MQALAGVVEKGDQRALSVVMSRLKHHQSHVRIGALAILPVRKNWMRNLGAEMVHFQVRVCQLLLSTGKTFRVAVNQNAQPN